MAQLPAVGPDKWDRTWDEIRWPHYFDRRGRMISLRRWVQLSEYGRGYKFVGNDRVLGYDVSTIWLGIDHGWNESKAPVLFETMVFERRLTWSEALERDHRRPAFDLLHKRYCTEDEARRGHWATRRQVRELAHRLNGPPPLGGHPTWVRLATGQLDWYEHILHLAGVSVADMGPSEPWPDAATWRSSDVEDD